MKRKCLTTVLAALLFLLVAFPAQASVWRSTTGNIFRFQPDGNFTVLYTNGTSGHGRWWWHSNGTVFDYQYFNQSDFRRVYITGNTARNVDRYVNDVTYWTYLGQRGQSEEFPPIKGWFMDAYSTPTVQP